MMELIKNTKIDFIGLRKIAFTISGVLVIIGIFSFIMISLGKANLSIDFTGGTNVQVRFSDKVNIGDLRHALESGGISDVQIQEVSGTRDFFIKTKLGDTEKESVATRITTILSKQLKTAKFEVLGSNMVGPGVGKELKKYAIIAIIIAFLGIIIYIAWRFTFASGIAATIATFHDVLVICGVFYFLGKEFNLLIITALLTIAGYSLQDTVVVFDRIRENSAKMKSRDDFGNIINNSINEVLSRTIVTGITTLISLAAIMIFGGEVLFDFAFAVFLGLIVGTYSSIFVASPIVYVWRKKI